MAKAANVLSVIVKDLVKPAPELLLPREREWGVGDWENYPPTVKVSIQGDAFETSASSECSWYVHYQ